MLPTHDDLPLVGEIEDDALPRGGEDFFWTRVELRLWLRRLPSEIAAPIRRVRREYLADRVLGEVRDHVLRLAQEQGVLRQLEVDGLPPRTLPYVPAIHLRRLCRLLVRDSHLVAHVRHEVETALREGNRDLNYPGVAPSVPSRPPNLRPPVLGVWAIPSSVGLGTASHGGDVRPEGVALGLAQHFRDHVRGDRTEVCDLTLQDRRRVVRVLDWGAGPSVFARAALCAGPPRTRICEVEVLGDTLPYAQVAYRDSRLPEPATPSFDLVLAHVPPPGDQGRWQYRNRYKNREQRQLPDFGTMGVTRWKRSLPNLLKNLTPYVRDDGEFALTLPLGVRHERHYVPERALLDGVVDRLGQLGFGVTHDLEVRELDPLPQPFVDRERCPWRCLIARRDGPRAS